MTGSGTSEDPYIISSLTDLQAMEDNLGSYYELGDDVDAVASSELNSGLGFAPISTFTGQLDGKGYTIDRLFVSRAAQAAALFSTNAGTVQNVGMTNCNFYGASVGTLAYKNEGTITKCYATGVTLGTGFVAGFVQWNTGTITNSYSRATVTGTGTGFAGGFVQYNNGGTIDDCYSTGAVSNMTGVAGFCQSNDNVITNCFWDTTTSGQAASDGGTGKTTAQMKTLATFTDAGWDFATIWNLHAQYNDGYPFLQIITATVDRRDWRAWGDEFHWWSRGKHYKVKGTEETGSDLPWWFFT